MSTFDASVTITIWAMILLYDPYQFNLYVFDLMDEPLTDRIDPYLEALLLSSAQLRDPFTYITHQIQQQAQKCHQRRSVLLSIKMETNTVSKKAVPVPWLHISSFRPN